MRVAVLGPGGVGGLIAGALDSAGTEVVVVARESTAASIAQDGVACRASSSAIRRPPACVALLTEPVDG